VTLDVDRARELGHAALLTLEASKRRLDDLNVYPVPDGDTGTNLALTVRAIVHALDASNAPDHASLGRELSRAALLGACGNSGVILSQIVRGFSDALGEADAIDGAALARAFRSASDAAYRAVQEPAEGTILTVVRELAEEAEKPEVQALASAGLFDRVVERGELAVARTTELLPILSEAGVVDAGGAGLLEIVRGLAAAVAGRVVPSETVEVEELGFEAIHQELSRYRYCTGFVVEGQGLDADELERELELERLGDSLLVVGDSSALRIHVHTDDPGAALTAAIRRGAVDAVEIANMHKQSVEREQRLSVRDQRPSTTARTAVVAVALGAGNRRLFEENPGSCTWSWEDRR
jgi:fatty acid kinase